MKPISRKLLFAAMMCMIITWVWFVFKQPDMLKVQKDPYNNWQEPAVTDTVGQHMTIYEYVIQDGNGGTIAYKQAGKWYSRNWGKALDQMFEYSNSITTNMMDWKHKADSLMKLKQLPRHVK